MKYCSQGVMESATRTNSSRAKRGQGPSTKSRDGQWREVNEGKGKGVARMLSAILTWLQSAKLHKIFTVLLGANNMLLGVCTMCILCTHTVLLSACTMCCWLQTMCFWMQAHCAFGCMQNVQLGVCTLCCLVRAQYAVVCMQQ